MTCPYRLPREVITQGQTFAEPYSLLNEDGSAKDVSNKDVLFRYTPQAGGAPIDRFSGNAGETGFPSGEDGTQGNIFPVFEHTFVVEGTFPAGFYDLEIWVEDEATTPDDRKPVAEGLIEVVPAKGGIPTPLDV